MPLVMIHLTMELLGKLLPISFLRIIGSRAFVHEEGHREKLDQRGWEGVKWGAITIIQCIKLTIALRVR